MKRIDDDDVVSHRVGDCGGNPQAQASRFFQPFRNLLAALVSTRNAIKLSLEQPTAGPDVVFSGDRADSARRLVEERGMHLAQMLYDLDEEIEGAAQQLDHEHFRRIRKGCSTDRVVWFRLLRATAAEMIVCIGRIVSNHADQRVRSGCVALRSDREHLGTVLRISPMDRVVLDYLSTSLDEEMQALVSLLVVRPAESMVLTLREMAKRAGCEYTTITNRRLAYNGRAKKKGEALIEPVGKNDRGELLFRVDNAAALMGPPADRGQRRRHPSVADAS
jgi:hypothetical protein